MRSAMFLQAWRCKECFTVNAVADAVFGGDSDSLLL